MAESPERQRRAGGLAGGERVAGGATRRRGGGARAAVPVRQQRPVHRRVTGAVPRGNQSGGAASVVAASSGGDVGGSPSGDEGRGRGRGRDAGSGSVRGGGSAGASSGASKRRQRGSSRQRVRVRDFVDAMDDTKLKHLFQEWSRAGWLVEQRSLLRGRYCERPRQYADSIVLIAEREEQNGQQQDHGAYSNEGGRGAGMGIVGFVCVGLKQVFLGEGSLRAGFIFDLRVRPGARFTSTGMSLLNEIEKRCVQRGVSVLYSSVQGARSIEGARSTARKTQRLFRKMGYTPAAECTLRHWILNTSAEAAIEGAAAGAEAVAADQERRWKFARRPILAGLPTQLRRGVRVYRTGGNSSLYTTSASYNVSEAEAATGAANAAAEIRRVWGKADLLPAGADALELLTASPAFLGTYTAELREGIAGASLTHNAGGGGSGAGWSTWAAGGEDEWLSDDEEDFDPTVMSGAGSVTGRGKGQLVSRASVSLWDGSALSSVEVSGGIITSAAGQAAIAALAGVLIVLYWQLMLWLHASAFYIILLGLLALTALGAAIVFRGAKLFEFVAGSWTDQRYRVRLFGVVAEGEHGEVLLSHLMGLAHDEARHRGFLGAVCTVLDTDDVAETETKKARKRLKKEEQGSAPAAAEGGGNMRSDAALLLSTASAFPARANSAPILLVAKGTLRYLLSSKSHLPQSLCTLLSTRYQLVLAVVRSGLRWAGGSK
eukprot:COSAG02_NODE_3379_length_6839_cov_2.979970_6_plen_717_part_00